MNKLLISLLLVMGLVDGAIHRLEDFENWINKFNIVVGSKEKETMFGKWLENDKYIEEMNSRNLTYTLGHNQYSGMDSDDYSKMLKLMNREERREKIEKVEKDIEEIECVIDCVKGDDGKLEKLKCVKGCMSSDMEEAVELDSEVNWVKKGGVTDVKNQGQCGSCWSFSTTGALEGAYYVKYGELKSFSEQQLVDCDNRKNGGKDMGCNGGLMDNAFSWIKKNDGLCYESDYPYTSGSTRSPGTCETSCEVDEKSKVESYTDVKKNSDDAMMEALMKQPVSVAIQADQKDFQLYKSGVFTGSCGTKLDHGVLLVGYGEKSGEEYYLLKNSWGETWGDNGYMYLGKGDKYNKGEGQCGVLMQGSYPNL